VFIISICYHLNIYFAIVLQLIHLTPSLSLNAQKEGVVIF